MSTDLLIICSAHYHPQQHLQRNQTPHHTFFNPISLEIEMVEHDASTLAIGLFGNQTKSMDDGIYTIYNEQNLIYKQYNLYEVRDSLNKLLFEVRESRGTDIDYSKNFNNITQ
jgi:hypothetical protein